MNPKSSNPFLSNPHTRSNLMRLGAMLLTTGVASAANLYWDTNATTAGSGNTGGNWAGANWNSTEDGTGPVAVWNPGDAAIFSAGTDGTGSWNVDLGVTISASSLTFKEAADTRNINGAGTINFGDSPGTINSSANGVGDDGGNNGRDVNLNVILAGTGGLTIAAHGNHIANGGGGGGGGSELRLNANNTFSGGLTITSGLVSWNTDAHLGDASNVITLDGGGSLNTGALHTTNRSFLVGANGGTFRLYGSTTLILNGPISSSAGATILRRTDGGTFRMFGSMSGFTGTWHNGNGTTQAAAVNADWSNTDLVLQGGNFTANGTGTATVNSITGNTDVYFDYGTTLDVDSGSITLTAGGNWRTNLGALGKLTSSSGTLAFTSGADSGTLSTSNPSMQVEIANSGATPVALVKNNVGNLILAKANTYTGGTTVNAGRLDSYHPEAFGSGAVTVNNGGQAYLTGGLPYANDFTLNGNGPTEAISLGALRLGTPAVLSGNLTIASASRIGVAANEFGTISGSITGTAAVEKAGTGILSLTGDASAYSGPITVTQGALNIGTTLPGDVTAADLAVIAGEGTIGGSLTLGTDVGSDIAVNGSTPGALSTTDLTAAGTTLVRLLSHPEVPGTPIPIVNYSGTLTLPGTADDSFDLVGAGLFRNTPVFEDTGSAITLTIPAGANLVWAGTPEANAWNQNGAANWLDGVTPEVFFAGDNVLFDDTAANKTVVMQNGLLSPATVTFDNSAGNDYNITPNGVDFGFTGPASIVKNGTGTATIQGYSHNYTGTVTINGGVLQGNGNYEVLGNSSGVFVNNGGQLNINGLNLGNGTRHYTMTIAGAGPDGLGAITNSAGGAPNQNAGILHLNLSDHASIGGNGGRYDIGRSGGGQTFGTINGNGFTLTKVGTGSVCLRAPSTDITYAVSAGTLKVEDTDLALGPNTVAVNGGTLQAYGFRHFANAVDFAAGTTLDNDGGGNQRWAGPFNLTGTAADNVNLNARNGAITLDNVISGTSNITAIGNNILYLAGSESNTFSGTTTIASTGQLVLSKTGGAVAVSGDLILAATGTRALVSATHDNQFGPDSVVRYTGTGDNRFELKGTTQTVAGLDSTGATPGYINIQHSEFAAPAAVDGVSDLIVNVSGANSFTYGGVLRDQGGKVNLTKSGPGTQIFTGTLIDYTGPTVVTGGRMIVDSDDCHSASLDIAAGAVYEASITSLTNTFEHTPAGFTLSGGGTYVKSGPGNMSITWSGGGSVAMASGALIEITNGVMRLEYGGLSNWTANLSDLTVSGSGALNLWDNNNAGVFVDALNGDGQIIRTNHAATGNLTVGVDDGSGDFAGSISNAVGKTNLIKNGTGTQTLSGDNSYTGNTTINDGAIVLSETGWLRFAVTDAASNTVNGSGTFTANGGFLIDTSAVTVSSGTWNLVNTSSLTAAFGEDFTVSGWTLDDGNKVWTLEDGNKVWTFSEATGDLELVSTNSYATWIDGFFPGETDEEIIGATADPDHDGIANAVEMVIGGNPATGMDTALLPTIELVTDPAGAPAGDYLVFTYRRSDLSVATGLTAAVEYDTDLVAPWSVAQDGIDGVVVLVDDNYASFVPPAADTDRVRVFVPRAANQTLFGRLQVTVPAP